MPELTNSRFELECALTRIGDTLDERGWQPWEDEADSRVEITCLSYDFERWFERKPAREEEVIDYLAAKVYWAWRYDELSTIVSASDLIRLRLPWSTVDRMAQLGDGVKWKREPGSYFLIPESHAIREYHDEKRGKNKPDQSIAAMLSSPRYRGPREHWAKALNFMSADSRDLANGAKEAISAVEGLARLIIKDDTATLGECLKTLKQKNAIDPAMIKSMEGLWGFTSNAPGVRHGAAGDQSIQHSEAQYVIASAAAAIQLLLSLDR